MTTKTKENKEVQTTEDINTQEEASTLEAAIPEIEMTFGINVKKMKAGEYIETVGRRKTSTAQVRLTPGAKKTTITVNGESAEKYFPTADLRQTIEYPLTKIKYPESFTITAMVNGGGMTGQAEAVRHGISRALTQYDTDTRIPLKRLGFLKRDPRSKERKKPGLKKARKSSQWSKR